MSLPSLIRDINVSKLSPLCAHTLDTLEQGDSRNRYIYIFCSNYYLDGIKAICLPLSVATVAEIKMSFCP